MNRLPLALFFAAAIAFAGCAAPVEAPHAEPFQEAPAPDPAAPATPATPTAPAAPPAPHREGGESVRLRGHVLTPSLQPIAGANVTVVGLESSRTTPADGSFDFGALARRIYTLQAAAPGHAMANLTVAPDEADKPIQLVLAPGFPVTPHNTTVRFRGLLECALEALILSPSCDSVLTEVPGAPRLFRENQSFLFQADPGWTTLVVDVAFDGDAHPGLDGLRMALRGSLDPDGGGEYRQYGRWNDAASFTVRVEPGGSYADGVEAVPRNATGFQVDVYPQSHAYHEACGGGSCFLGVGAATNVEFQLLATLFYVEPAPPGFTLLGGR